MKDTRERSNGHIGFLGAIEYFVRGGDILSAIDHAPVMTDGYRCGRWFCYNRKTDVDFLTKRLAQETT